MTDKAEKNVVPFVKGAKTFYQLSDDPRIEVLCVSAATKQVETRSFRASMIDYLESAGADKSAIVLQSGTTITLSLPYAELAAKIDEGASPIDLKEYSEAVVPAVEPKIGDRMEDGTIFAGISPDTYKPMYAAPADASLSLSFYKAAQYASELEVGGKKGFRVPTENELNVLFQNKEKGALAGTFNLTGSSPAGWYWSSTPYAGFFGHCQRLSDGLQVIDTVRRCVLSVRCVRS